MKSHYEDRHLSKMRWYYEDRHSTKMYCGYCYEDDNYCIITNTEDILNMNQIVECKFCGWCPKRDGLVRKTKL